MENVLLPEKWKDWIIDEELGSGDYGAVYKAHLTDDEETQAAIKVLRLAPKDENDDTDYEQLVNDFYDVIKSMDDVANYDNIVMVDDYHVDHEEGSNGWTLYMRKELLEPLTDEMKDRVYDDADILRMSLDMCNALEVCEEKHILHGEIKPKNIMLNKYGSYKLDGFGVTGGEAYDAKADQYALSKLLMGFLNEGSSEDIRKVFEKGCSENPDDRYEDITEMKGELLDILGLKPVGDMNRETSRLATPILLWLAIFFIVAAVLIFFIESKNFENVRKMLNKPSSNGVLLGEDNDNLTWRVTRNTLTISGKGVIPDYREANKAPWSGYDYDYIVVEEGITAIGDRAFYESENAIKVTLPDSLESIGSESFAMCPNLGYIEIPKNVNHVDGIDLFGYCHKLASIKVDPENKTYDSRDNCNAIIETSSNTLVAGCSMTEIPDSVIVVGRGSMYGQRRLDNHQNIVIPKSVKVIDTGAFKNSNIKTCVLEDGVASIERKAFAYCGFLEEIEIPESVKAIDETAFLESTNVTIKGKAGSVAETYAKDHDIAFVTID